MGSLGLAFGKHMGSILVIASDCLYIQISEGIAPNRGRRTPTTRPCSAKNTSIQKRIHAAWKHAVDKELLTINKLKYGLKKFY
jgi:hypothetical protein